MLTGEGVMRQKKKGARGEQNLIEIKLSAAFLQEKKKTEGRGEKGGLYFPRLINTASI